MVFHSASFAVDSGENVNVVLEIEGEFKFEPFKKESLGVEGFADNGFMRVVSESDEELGKYEALGQAMVKSKKAIFDVMKRSYVDDGVTMEELVKAIPPFIDEENNDKEKPFDYEKYLDNVKECGRYKNSGRFYDEVEGKGYACLEVKLSDILDTINNEKYSAFKEMSFSTDYRPLSAANYRYDGLIIDAREIEYQPQMGLKIVSPSEEVLYHGVVGLHNILYAQDSEQAKELLKSHGARRIYNVKAQGTAKDVGVKLSLPDSDRFYSVFSKNKKTPVVIIYKKIQELPPVDGEE
jgi:hypothetical protein